MISRFLVVSNYAETVEIYGLVNEMRKTNLYLSVFNLTM